MRPQLILITSLALISTAALADDRDYNWKRSNVYTAIRANESAIDDLDSRIQTNTNNIQSLQTQIQNLPTGGGTGSGTPDPQTQVNTTAINDLDSRVQNNTNAIGNLTTQVQANTATNASQDTQIQSNSGAIGGVQTNLQNMQGTVNDLATDIGTVQSDLTNINAQVQANASGVANNSTRLDALETAGTGGGTPTPVEFDFTPYVTTMATKDFQVINGGACTTALQQIARTDTATGADITVRETLTSGARDCTTYVYDYTLDATSLSMSSYSNLTLGQTYPFDQPGAILTNSMETGKSFGFAVLASNNLAVGTIQKSTLLGIESVTVPFGSFDNCLKIHTQTTSSMMNDVEQISWVCGNGLGEVRRILMDKGVGQVRTYVLRNAS